MKKLRLFAIIAIAVAIGSAFVPKEQENFSIKRVEKNLIQTGDNLYASAYETTNLEYRTFLNESDAKLKASCTLDTANWMVQANYAEPLASYYHTHVAYNNYPVVNVSYHGAKEFCKWLSEKYNAWPKRKFKKVRFRLPNEKEWEQAAYGGKVNFLYPWGGPDLDGHCKYFKVPQAAVHFDKNQNAYVLIIKKASTGVSNYISGEDIDTPVAVNSYQPNGFGIYNICGNVAEMMEEKGITRGGGWLSAGGDVQIKSRAEYAKSQIDVGFRYFMEVIEE
jgi:formylglycine-generating enzyme required for sulfatase activity